MSHIFHDIKVGLDEELEDKLQWMVPGYSSYHLLKKSVDARRRHAPHLIYSVEVFGEDESPAQNNYPVKKISFSGQPPLVIGAGPAGLFAALRLVERGIPCHIFEQGSEAPKRMKAITRFWRYGELDERNNVCYGEGGAGLYSDGKLITRIKSPHIPYVMHRLVKFGAPEEIQYLANPHVGSDRIRRIIPKIRQSIIDQGGQFHFDTRVDELLTSNNQVTGIRTDRGDTYHSDHVIWACGHSAEPMFQHLRELGVHIEGKSFAVGLRIEHPQGLINKIQYRDHADHPKLGAANYRLAHHDKKSDVGVYSFCMCPGGYVLSSGTESTGVVCNGMSNYNRNSRFANAAIVGTIDYTKSFGQDPFAGLEFRKQLEQNALNMVTQAGGDKQLPVQTLNDFIQGRGGTALKSSCPSGVVATRLDQLFSPEFSDHLRRGLQKFDGSMTGFINDSAQLHGVESRTSCPLRITRHKQTLQSLSHPGLYPTGEGAGYAGGITSAACDGVRVADQIANVEQSLSQNKTTSTEG